MQRNSVILVVLATVVLVSVATFVVVSDDGEQGIHIELRDVEPGDAVTLEKTVGDKTTSYRMTVVSIEDDTVEMLLTSSNGMKKIVQDTLVGCTEDLTVKGDMYTDLAEEDRAPIYTYMGLRECILYSCGSKNPDIDHVWADAENGLVYESMGVKDGEDMHIVYTGISMLNVFSPGETVDLDDEVKSFDEVVPGDYYTISERMEIENGHMELLTDYYVLSVDTKERRVVCMQDPMTSMVPVEPIEMTEAEFMGKFLFDVEGNGMVAGDRVVLDTDFGPRDCTKYTNPNGIQTFYIGTGSGILYKIESEGTGNNDMALSDTSMFVGNEPVDIDGQDLKAPSDIEVGDFIQLRVDIYEGPDEEVEVIKYTVTEVDREAGTVSCTSGHGPTVTFTAQEFIDLLRVDFDEGAYDKVVTGVTKTDFGYRVCDIGYEGQFVSMVVGSGDGICYYKVFEFQTETWLITLLDTSLFV